MNIITGKLVKVSFKCRDIGYGIETGTKHGRFTGVVDSWGKWTFKPTSGHSLYLFRDEIKSCRAITAVRKAS